MLTRCCILSTQMRKQRTLKVKEFARVIPVTKETLELRPGQSHVETHTLCTLPIHPSQSLNWPYVLKMSPLVCFKLLENCQQDNELPNQQWIMQTDFNILLCDKSAFGCTHRTLLGTKDQKRNKEEEENVPIYLDKLLLNILWSEISHHHSPVSRPCLSLFSTSARLFLQRLRSFSPNSVSRARVWIMPLVWFLPS